MFLTTTVLATTRGTLLGIFSLSSPYLQSRPLHL